MKKGNVMIIASVVHAILWIVVLIVNVIGRIMYENPRMEPLEFQLTKGVYNVFIIIAVAGVFSAGLLLFTLCSVSTTEIIKSNALKKTAFVFSIITNMLFYLSVILFFLINKDVIIAVPIVWALCATCCFILIIAGAKKE